MESASGSTQNSTVACTIATATTTITTVATPGSSTSSSSTVSKNNNNTSVANVAAAVLPPTKPLLQLETKQEEANNLSLASAISEGQRSLSGAPSASSSPILSPPGKIFGRNANGTMIATSRPSNEAEVQLYRVLQRASLLAYYDTLLEMGGDDVQQLYEAGEEEFLEIMALVGMASKPLHVRRLQKALHEWANNPALFQGPIIPGMAGFCDTPTKPISIYNPEPRAKCSSLAHAFNPTPLISTAQTSSTPAASPLVLPQLPPTPSAIVPPMLQHAPLSLPASMPAVTAAPLHPQAGATSHQVTSSSPQLTPVLTELQVARITLGAEKIARQLPQREPRAQTSKKRTSRELEQVIAMSENDPRRMDEIRKYSAIYGRFDCKRRPEKPLTLHEVCVNEAAAQLCRLVPALLTRRDELFPLARQIVKDAGFGHSASIARYGGLIPQVNSQSQSQQAQRSSVVVVDCESSDSSSVTPKRQRLSSTDTATTPDFNRETMDDSRYNLFAMYQKFAKPPFDLSDIAKFSLGKSDYDDNDNDNESRYSFSNSSSPSMTQHNGSENDRDFSDGALPQIPEVGIKSPTLSQPLPTTTTSSTIPSQIQAHIDAGPAAGENVLSTPTIGGVQVISAAGGHIIAVANPALALSPTLNDTLNVKREVDSPEIL